MTQMHLSDELKEKWASALESGDYQQAQGALTVIREGNARAHCCLGVLCKLMSDDGVVMETSLFEDTWDNRTLLRYGQKGERYGVPLEVRQFIGGEEVLGTDASNPSVMIPDDAWPFILAAGRSPESRTTMDNHRNFNFGEDCPRDAVTLSALNDAGVPFGIIALVIRRYG